MALPYDRTIERLDLIHARKAEGAFTVGVVLSRVGDGSAVDHDFCQWAKANYPLFDPEIFARGEWLGLSRPPRCRLRTSAAFDGLTGPLRRRASLPLLHGKAEDPIGDASKSRLLEIHNSPE
ncbi:MAG: hypothetical protein AB7F22_08640 [Reyranella sp.]|uniref:hypothetical protein n=1 Tax=Reyranella sp. TaxID=1929291 RepID=UPI003D13114C